MKLIVGLGNPEDKYAGTRHNLGFEILDELVKKLNLVDFVKEDKFKAEVIKVAYEMPGISHINEFANQFLSKEIFPAKEIEQIILAKPQTYMNNSGMAVQLITSYYKIAPEDIVIIHDELDLPLGKIKVRLGGAAAGHHGVESIIKDLGTDQFVRIRLGIGNLKTQSSEHKGKHVNAEKFVLEPFMHSEKASIKRMIKQSLKAVETLLEKGLETAQNQFN